MHLRVHTQHCVLRNLSLHCDPVREPGRLNIDTLVPWTSGTDVGSSVGSEGPKTPTRPSTFLEEAALLLLAALLLQLKKKTGYEAG